MTSPPSYLDIVQRLISDADIDRYMWLWNYHIMAKCCQLAASHLVRSQSPLKPLCRIMDFASCYALALCDDIINLRDQPSISACPPPRLFAIENVLRSATWCPQPQRRSTRMTVAGVKRPFASVSELAPVCQTRVGSCHHLPHQVQQQEVTPATRAALDSFNHFGACDKMLHRLTLWKRIVFVIF